MERERRTLAAEVHDGLAQYLAVARRELALPEPDQERLREAVESAHRLVRARLQTLSSGTPVSLRDAIEAAARRSRAAVHVSGHGDTGPEIVTLASRVVSEALANADAHGQAHVVEIRYAVDREAARSDRRRRWPRLRSRDARSGVEDGHLGLTVMRERARGYGGDCEITSAPGAGTRVRLWIPL